MAVVVRRLLKVGGVIGLLGVFLTYVTFVRPEPRERTKKADVVVVLAGENSRLKTGLRLVQDGVAPRLVISNGNAKSWKSANKICHAHYAFEVLCPKPATDDTQGEAHTISRLARQLHWHTIVIVSSNYHLRRAKLLFNRCTKANLKMYSSDVDRLSFGEWLGATLEWPKFLHAQLSRAC